MCVPAIKRIDDRLVDHNEEGRLETHDRNLLYLIATLE